MPILRNQLEGARVGNTARDTPQVLAVTEVAHPRGWAGFPGL